MHSFSYRLRIFRLYCIVLFAGLSNVCSAAADLREELANAPPEQVFAAEISFNHPIPVGVVRRAIDERSVPRGFAYVERDPLPNGRTGGRLSLAMGTLYGQGKALTKAECEALVLATGSLAAMEINDWPASKIYINANAFNLLDLLRDTRLQGALLVSANPVLPRYVERLKDMVDEKFSEPIFVQQSTELPAYCDEFLQTLDAPILAGGFPPGFVPPKRNEGENEVDHAYRVLADIAANSIVTMAFQLDFPSKVESIARLVAEYRVLGAQAELSPVGKERENILDAEFSPYGEGLDVSVRRAQCRMIVANDQHSLEGEWLSGWISVSLQREDATDLLAHPEIKTVRVYGSFPPWAVSRLQSYYEPRSQRVEPVPSWVEIPSHCDDLFITDPGLSRGGTFQIAPD